MSRAYLGTGSASCAFVVIDLGKIDFTHGDSIKGTISLAGSKTKACVFTANRPFSYHISSTAILDPQVLINGGGICPTATT
ncbi:MAG: hypothetical protein DRG71_02395 [Deltaproteobacteria bacterium]|nr:MAG: hypothetical protein DRG71_02395 [Deltaproteobacteria bacterium]